MRNSAGQSGYGLHCCHSFARVNAGRCSHRGNRILIWCGGIVPPTDREPGGALSRVERDFRSLKTIDVDLRPIHHHLETRVKAHVLICMLAAYLVGHLRQAWAPYLTRNHLRVAGHDETGFDLLAIPTPTPRRGGVASSVGRGSRGRGWSRPHERTDLRGRAASTRCRTQ